MAENDSSRESMDEDADLLAAAADDEQRLQEATAESDGEASVGSKSESGSDYRAENGDDQPSGDEIGDLHHDDDDDDEEASSSGEEELVPKKRQNRSRKIPEDVLRYAEQDCLRRSGRQRKEVQRLEVGQGSDSDEKPKRTRKRQKPDDWNGNSLSDSEDSSGSFVERRTVTRRPVNKRSKRKRGSSSDFDSDDSVPRRSIRKGKTSQVDYRDVDSDNGIDDDDVLEWQEEDSQTATVDGVAVETVERVLKHRLGRPTAIGHATTYYNVEERGDPNADFSATVSGETPERQYLIKWVGWSHMHNTWESEASLHLMNAKGMKKIENYVKRLREITEWRRNADKEYIEYFDCEQEMSEELCEQYKVVERVIAHQVSRERGTDSGTEYFVKWCGLPYSECTWEDSALIGRWYQKTIDAYHERSQSNRIPSKLCQALRRRPKFHKFETMPDFLLINDRNEQELRDYQLDGLNWLLRAWSKQNCSILADEMGLGKTIQSISFLSALYHFHDVYGPFLVVVPLSTMAAWQREFDNWAPDMNVIVYMGDVVSRDIIRQFEWYSPGTKRLKFNVVLTTYEILLKDK
uniref:DNA helicase n=1 Tax=Plectus sambesii TaxID=2011161 RepID=A0A914VAC2_9BILA